MCVCLFFVCLFVVVGVFVDVVVAFGLFCVFVFLLRDVELVTC